MRGLILGVLAAAGVAEAQVHEPPKGSEDRTALMDAIRPHAEWHLGAPVEFVVTELRVSGDLAFAMLEPQRPGGAPIALEETPMVVRAESADWFDGTGMQVLYVKSGETWVALHFGIGPTDVWWSAPELCADFAPVLDGYC